jgi:hypothetical protein
MSPILEENEKDPQVPGTREEKRLSFVIILQGSKDSLGPLA